MRCKKAKEDYLSNRDGLLSEAGRIRLQQHLEVCAGCAGFAREMDECLGVLEELPQMEVSDNFEWNLKMKIAREKSRMMRDRATPLLSSSWGMKFVGSMAAALIVVLAGAYLVLRDEGPQRETAGTQVAAERPAEEMISQRASYEMDFTDTGYPAGIRMVSDEMPGVVQTGNYMRQSPFSMDNEKEMEYLIKENEALKKYLEHYKAENAYLKKLILQRSSQR